MANATSGTVNNLVANGFLANPAGDTLDTGTAAVTLDYDVAGDSNRVVFQVTNNSAVNLTVGIIAGAYPPAFQAGRGAYLSANLAAAAVGWYGPFESAQFIQAGADSGELQLTITPASGTIAATIRCFQLPKVV
jgi:hypothetical protein